MAEIAISAYRRSYFETPDSIVHVASARAGNVIGGGDWAEDRIVPDSIRALQAGSPIPVRNRVATRPWQHVLEPLSGYLWQAASLALGRECPLSLNFGPTPDCTRCVEDLVIEILNHWPGTWEDRSNPNALHEAKLLSLCIEKAAKTLHWQPVWNFERTLAHTVDWYRSSHEGDSPQKLTIAQIEAYCQDATAAGLSWTH
jgi:CDP-glucose 4,6-dehydratase